MILTDIAGVAKIAHARGVEVSVDNTFLSPALQRPLELGADIVMHSTRQYLNGHSDGLGGALIGSKPEHTRALLGYPKGSGRRSCRPSNASSCCAGIKTAAAAHQAARRKWPREWRSFFRTHAKVSKLAYPGLKNAIHNTTLR